MSLEDCEVLGTALAWLGPSVRQTVNHLNHSGRSFNEYELEIYVGAARLRFLHSYFAASVQDSSEVSVEGEPDENDTIEWHDLVVAMKRLSGSGTVEHTLTMMPARGFDPSTLETNEGWVNVVSAKQEASACSFVDALASLLYIMSTTDEDQFAEGQSQGLVTSALSTCRALFET